MAKTTGLGDNFYSGGYDLGGDTASLSSIHGGPAALDATDITQSGFGRLGGLRDGGIQWVSYMDPAAAASHALLSQLLTTDVISTYYRGATVGNPAAACVSRQINYDGTRAADGMLTFGVDGQGDGFGLEWGVMLTGGKRTDTSATAGSAFDNTAAGANGAQAYLQVFAFTGTDATVKVQHATTSGGSYTDLITFTQTTAAPGAQRAVAAGTVNEFLKVTTVTTGGFTSLVFAVMIAVNPVAVAF
jgi:hypothetical protein